MTATAAAAPDTAPAPGRSPLAATGLVVLAACGFGSISLATTSVLAHGGSLEGLMFWRYLAATPLLVLAAGGVARARLPRRDAWRLLLFGGLYQTVISWLSLSSLHWINAATLGFLFFSFPAWTALIAAARGTERLTAVRALALALVLVGILLMVGSPWAARPHPAGVLLALSAAVVYATFVLFLPRLQGHLPAAPAAAHIAAGSAICFAALAALRGMPLHGALGATLPLALLLGLFSTAVAFTAFFKGLAVLGPVRAAIVATIEPFYTALAAALLLGQPLTVVTLAGGACIAGAVLLLQVKS